VANPYGGGGGGMRGALGINLYATHVLQILTLTWSALLRRRTKCSESLRPEDFLDPSKSG